ncbi:MAG: hypothetical protein ABIT37_25705 [Luteolibacter sp.]
MENFRDITEAKARKIDRTMMGLAHLETLDELEERFMEEAGRLLPADCLCWNNWERDLSGLQSYRSNAEYGRIFGELVEVFGEVVMYHPVIAANQLAASTETVQRISDFQTSVAFRENPLFREVYRHLDSLYQISYTASMLKDRRIVLTWNRRALDFSEQDQQIFKFMGLRLGAISRRIEERQQLEKNWRVLCGFVDARMDAGTVLSLGTQDVTLLTELLRSRKRSRIASELGIRRDSVDKRLGSIRERLGLENHHQLLSALAELKNTAKTIPSP